MGDVDPAAEHVSPDRARPSPSVLRAVAQIVGEGGEQAIAGEGVAGEGGAGEDLGGMSTLRAMIPMPGGFVASLHFR
jgi:hypothetical protein